MRALFSKAANFIRGRSHTEFARLEARKQELLKGNFFRTPREPIQRLIEELLIFGRRNPGFASRVNLAAAGLYAALWQIAPALSALTEVAASGKEHAAQKGADILTACAEKPGKRHLYGDMEKILAAAGSLAAASPSGFHRNRLEMLIALLNDELPRALLKADESFVFDAARSVKSLARVTDFILRKKADPDLLQNLGTVIRRHHEAIERNGGKPFFLRLKLFFRSSPATIELLGLGELDATKLERELDALTIDELTLLIKHNRFASVDSMPEAERLRAAVLKRHRKLLPETSRERSNHLYMHLRAAGQTLRFWNEPAWREDLLSFLDRLAEKEETSSSRLARGSIAFLRRNFDLAETHFAAASRMDTNLTIGAGSFFSRLTPGGGTALLDSGGVEFSADPRSPLAVLAAADGRYFRSFAADHLHRIRSQGFADRVHFHIAGSRGEVEDVIAGLAGDGHVTFSFERPPIRTPAYYASMRFLRAPLFLERVADRLLIADIDLRVRFNCADWFRRLAEAQAELALQMYERVSIRTDGKDRESYSFPPIFPWSQVRAGIVYLSGSGGREAARAIAEDMASHFAVAAVKTVPMWYIDQNSLLFSFHRLRKSNLRIVNFEAIGLQRIAGTAPVQFVSEVSPALACEGLTSSGVGEVRLER